MKKKILEITGWQDFKTIAAEIQYNHKYNYQSTWHRDANFPSDEVTVIIYLKDAEGFRIIPKNRNTQLKLYGIDINKKKYLKKNGFLNFPKNYFEIVDAKKGDFIILESGLLHQGFSKGSRNQILLRFKKKSRTPNEIDFYENYNLSEELREHTSIKKLEELSKITESYNFKINYFSILNKFKSLIYFLMYYLPLHRIWGLLKDTDKKRTHFHFTHYQN